MQLLLGLVFRFLQLSTGEFHEMALFAGRSAGCSTLLHQGTGKICFRV